MARPHADRLCIHATGMALMSSAILNDRSAQLLMAVDGSEYDEARARLERAALVLDGDADLDDAHQAALLAAAMCAIKMFQGGVFIGPGVQGRLKIGQERRRPLRGLLEDLGALSINPPEHAARLHIGTSASVAPDVYAWCDGWTANVGPRPPAEPGCKGNVLSGAAAGAIAISDVFRRAVLNDVLACKRAQSLNVWGCDAHRTDAAIAKLPKSLWLLGLGNLGQATLFLLGLLPWPDPAEALLLLNDADISGPENLQVQILTTHSWIGQKKARAAAHWAEHRGFSTVVNERRFTASTTAADQEPRLALVGVDNLQTRRHAAAAGFDLLIDAGLGATGSEAFDIRVHAFPGTQTADVVWPELAGDGERPLPENLAKLVKQGRLPQCGAITLFGKSVGVPCTAVVAAAVQIAQACRALATGRCADRVDLSLSDLKRASWRPMPSDLARVPLAVDGLVAD